MTEQRVRLFRGSVLVQTLHPHPSAGMPTEVPVPRKTSSPEISAETGVGLSGAVLIAGTHEKELGGVSKPNALLNW